MHANASTEPGLQAGDRPVLLRQMHRGKLSDMSSRISRPSHASPNAPFVAPSIIALIDAVTDSSIASGTRVGTHTTSRARIGVWRGHLKSACATVAIFTVTACGRATAPSPVVAPTPVPVSAPVAAPLPARIAVASAVAERRYDVKSSARIERDSAGRKDEQRVESQGVVTWMLQRSPDGALRGSGRVDSFAVKIEGAGVAAPTVQSKSTSGSVGGASPTIFPAVAFDAILDAISVRVVTRPPLANECDRSESGATALVRDLLLRVPTSVVSGDRWRDSSVSIICRVGIPITVRSTHEYVLERVEGMLPATTLFIKRTTATRLEGKLGSAWRALELTGSGTGTDDARIDVSTGALMLLDGQGTLTLQLTDRSRPSTPRTQRITQQLTTHAEIRR